MIIKPEKLYSELEGDIQEFTKTVIRKFMVNLRELDVPNNPINTMGLEDSEKMLFEWYDWGVLKIMTTVEPTETNIFVLIHSDANDVYEVKSILSCVEAQ